MDIYQLSAGKPKKSEIPINLHNITFNKSIIKWQVEALKSAFEKFSLTVLVGFRSELYKLKIKNVKYYRISKWENTSILDTFLSIPFNQKSFICHYSDTIFSKDVFKKIK